MEQHLLSYFIGIFIIMSSHLYVLYKPNEPIMSMEYHSYINILGGCMIAYYFLNKENYISF
jgi:hypothetical protein